MFLETMEVSREEAKRILRRLELEAYSSIVSTFRAQGDLNREKKKLLTDLGVHLSISTERHRAEVRRAYSDDRLGSVAECIVGPSTCSEWAAEGRRLVPLMPRLVPQTILSGTATASANAAAAANAQVSAQVKKTSVGVVSSSTRETPSNSNASGASSAKPSPIKPLARQSSETIDVEYDSDDNKAKKKRKLSQSVTGAKPSPKMLLNPSSVVNKQGTKTASVSTSTMTKVGKQPSTAGSVKATQKLMLPASASQVKLLTKTVSITQTVCQAKTILNYKTVAAPAAVKVQTVMSHTAPKTQVKVAVPSKNVLVPKPSVSTSPSKPVTSPVKAGITMSHLAAKQRGKQTTRFKPVPGTVKYKPVTPATTAVTMATTSSNITTLTGSTISSIPSTQPIVRVIQVPSTGGIGISKPMIVMTTGPTKPTASVSSGTSVLKIPISSTTQSSTITSTTQAGRILSQAPTKSVPASSVKTVVMSTIVGGTKKVVLSVPAPITPIQAKPSAAVATSSAAKSTGLGSQLSQSPGDKQKAADKPTAKLTTVPSLECTETSSFLKAPPVTIPKPGTPSTISSQGRTRPLQTLLPAPPKPVAVAPSTPLPSAPTGRKLPQILPAPAKTAVLVPLATPATPTVGSSTVVSTAVVSTGGSSSKVPMVQLMPKSTQPTVVSKLSVSKTLPGSSTSVSPAGCQAKTSLPHSGLSQQVANESPGSFVETEPKAPVVSDSTVNLIPKSYASLTDTQKELTSQESSTHDDKPDEQETLKADHAKTEGDNNTSSEDDSMLVCSETIDSGAGLHDAPLTPEEISPVDRAGNLTLTSSPVEPFQTTTIPSIPLPNNIDSDHEKCSTEFLSKQDVANFPEKTTPGITGSSKFVEDFLNELDSVHDLKEKTQAKPCEIMPSAQDNRDFEKCKESEEVKTVSLQDLKNLAMDAVKDFDAAKNFGMDDVKNFEAVKNLPMDNVKDFDAGKNLPMDAVKDFDAVKNLPMDAVKDFDAVKNLPMDAVKDFDAVKNLPMDAVKDFDAVKNLVIDDVKDFDAVKNLPMDDVKDFDAVSSFLQSFVGENLSDQNAKDSSESSSVSSGLDSKELQEVNQGSKPDQTNEILAEPKQQNQELKMTIQDPPESSCLSGSLDINDISLNISSSKPLESLQSKVNNDVFALEKTQSHSNKVEHNLKDLPQNLYGCSTSFKESLCNQSPAAFVQGSIEQSLVENSDQHILKDSLQYSSDQSIKELPQMSVNSDIIGTMLAQSSSSGEHEQGLTETERLALEAIANVRTSGRKRKPPTILSLSPPRQTSGWIRGALSLLQKVCSYRGQGRKKGDHSAVSWFLRPVDPNEAPGYFKVIKTPMDFSTIKINLENAIYKDYTEFYDDMILIKTNCFKYNPPGHDIRKDCEEVFRYFEAEYEKMLERWEKCHVSPAKKPRTMPKSELATSMSC